MNTDDLGTLGENALLTAGSTQNVREGAREEHWRHIFGSLWGSEDIHAVPDQVLSGTLYTRKIGILSFSRMLFGNQIFKRSHTDIRRMEEPFYSLTFPDAGNAICSIGETTVQLQPRHAYLVNNSMTAEVIVDRHYSTFNVIIPTQSLEDRLGKKLDIKVVSLENPGAIYSQLQCLIRNFVANADSLNQLDLHFLSNQMLDTVAYFLLSGGSESDDSIAKSSHKARILAFLNVHYADYTLTPFRIATACNISKSYLYKLFQDDDTIMVQLRNRRLEAARGRILANPNRLKMTQIAMACGFKSSSEFSRLFSAHFGMVPSKYVQ